jgi:crotonobetainyl-CoA:carnitine CoA-transferase CaiB-like acyl-CoA transferase
LDTEIEKCLLVAKTNEWLEIFYAEDIVAGPLQKVDEVVADPQVNALNMILDIEHPLGGRIKVAGNPIMMDSLSGEHTAPQTLGQHTEPVLRDLLHYTDEKIIALRAEQKTTDLETRLHTRKEK